MDGNIFVISVSQKFINLILAANIVLTDKRIRLNENVFKVMILLKN
jgi:hypothetical protein